MSWFTDIRDSATSALGLKKSQPNYESYDIDKALRSGNIGVISDLGNMKLVQNPDGSYSYKYESSDTDKQRQNIMANILAGITGDTSDAQKAYYDQATRLLNERFSKQVADTDEALINRGIQAGTKQYNQVMGDLQENQQAQLSDIANKAIFAGQDLQSGQINQANALSGGRDIGSLAGMAGTNQYYNDYMTQQNAIANAKYYGQQQQGKNLAGAISGALTALPSIF